MVNKTLKSIDNKYLIVVETSKEAVPIENKDKDEIKDHSSYDPHLWISLKGAKLNKLYDEYAIKFKSLPKKDFVTGHTAFGYLCRDYGLNQECKNNIC